MVNPKGAAEQRFGSVDPIPGAPAKLEINNLSVSYNGKPALSGVNLMVHENEIFGIVGPANSGKSSLLKAVNRMDMFERNMVVSGEIYFSGRNIHKLRNAYGLRRRIGVVFPLPVGLPLSLPVFRSPERNGCINGM